MSKMPRIQARCGQATEPPEMVGKWFFEIVFSYIGSGVVGKPIGPFGPFDTEAAAKTKMREAVKMACEELETRTGHKTSGHYYDMKTNQMRKWDDN